MKTDYKAIGSKLQTLRNKASGMSIGVAADGGALDGTEIVRAVIDAIPEYSDSILKGLRWVEVQLNSASIPFDGDSIETEPSTGTRAYWVNEGVQKTISVPIIGTTQVECKKIVVRIPVTDELLADAVRLGEYLTRVASRKIAQRIAKEAMTGTNAIKGVMSDGDSATIVVPCTNLAAPTLAELKAAVDVINPLASPTWYVCPALYSYIAGGMAAVDNLKSKALQFEGGKYYLFGFPVERTPWLDGTDYAWLLGDFSQYVVVYHPPQPIISSDTPRFEYDESEFRLVLRCAGRPAVALQDADDSETYAWWVTHDGGSAAGSSSSSTQDDESSKSSLSSASSPSSPKSNSSDSSLSSLSSLSTLSSQSNSTLSSQSNSSDSTNGTSSESSLGTSSDSTLSTGSSDSTESTTSQSSTAVVLLSVGGGLTPSGEGDYDRAGTYASQTLYHCAATGLYIWYKTSANAYVLSAQAGLTSNGYAQNGTAGTDATGVYTGGNGWTGSATVSA